MAALKNPQAENDAQRVAKTWLKHGKKEAMIVYGQIIQRTNMREWEGVIFSNRVYDILYEKGATYTIADGVNKARQLVLPKGE
jgi:hypothetical protein